MLSIRLAHSLVGFMLVLVGSIASVSVAKHAAFKVQSYASPKLKATKSDDSPTQVAFANCPTDEYSVGGTVTSMTITPCNRSSPGAPCTFVFLSNYTIELDFVTTLNATAPRSSVVAYDRNSSYQYSGQSFNSCQYAVCPIRADKPSSYVYHFQTLASPFSSLTFNVTQDFTGPSLFCASTNVDFEYS